jgi:hypothetical protein
MKKPLTVGVKLAQKRRGSANPTAMATPPDLGIGRSWTFRGLGKSRAPPFLANFASGLIRRKVTSRERIREKK